jgi:hypothetical protein
MSDEKSKVEDAPRLLLLVLLNQSEFEVGDVSQNICDEKVGEADLRRTLTSSSRPQGLMNPRLSKKVEEKKSGTLFDLSEKNYWYSGGCTFCGNPPLKCCWILV